MGDRLRQYDPHRWEGVPITYQTIFCEGDAYRTTDISLVINIHDALEREFNIDIDDKKILLTNIENCVKFVMENHSSI